SLAPNFSVSRRIWFDAGGVYAIANLRGGGEFGEDWHKAGSLTKKQNVFDDFIACAEYLIRSHYTKPRKLAIPRGSNGGLAYGGGAHATSGFVPGGRGPCGHLRHAARRVGAEWRVQRNGVWQCERQDAVRCAVCLLTVPPGEEWSGLSGSTADDRRE